jgi:hypothetical protein
MWEASSGKIHELNSMGTIVPDLAPFTRVPQGKGGQVGDTLAARAREDAA